MGNRLSRSPDPSWLPSLASGRLASQRSPRHTHEDRVESLEPGIGYGTVRFDIAIAGGMGGSAGP